MSVNKTAIKAAICIYVIAGIATYGNAIAHFERKGEFRIAECLSTAVNKDYCAMYRATGLAGAVSSIAWPFYWSYRLQAGEK